MSIFDAIPPSARKAARALLPAGLVDGARDSLLRGLYLKSMVSRAPRIVVWARRHVLHQRPVLFHFEIHITDHCNLNCKGCAHFSNLCEPAFADLAEFRAEMDRMASLFSRVEEIYLMGGEPLLHPDVASFVRTARAFFPRSRICLMTNGLLVTRMAPDAWKALAETGVVLLCDSYPIGLPIDEIDRLAREHGALVEWTVPREEFFKIPIDPTGGHDMGASFRRCQGFNNCPIVRDGRLYPCAYVAYADVFRSAFGIEGLQVSERDSIAIRDEPDPDAVMEFLMHPVPWCSNCDMDSREFYTWGRSKRELSEWTRTPETGCASSSSEYHAE